LQLVPLEASKLKGVVSTQSRNEGWVDEWEVNPKELQLIAKIGSGEFGDVYKAKWHGSYVSRRVLPKYQGLARHLCILCTSAIPGDCTSSLSLPPDAIQTKCVR
jgi:serine/threonine protein kinase